MSDDSRAVLAALALQYEDLLLRHVAHLILHTRKEQNSLTELNSNEVEPNMKKPTVLVDMDGVISNILPIWLAAYRDRTGEALFVEDIKTYTFGACVKNEALFFELLYDAQLFRNAPPMFGASAFKRLYQNPALDVRVVTYVHPDCPDGHEQKLDWLKMYFADFDPSHVIFAKDKHLVRGDFLIEDNPENIERWLEAHPDGRAVCMNAPYNKSFEHDRIIGYLDSFDYAVRRIEDCL